MTSQRHVKTSFIAFANFCVENITSSLNCWYDCISDHTLPPSLSLSHRKTRVIVRQTDRQTDRKTVRQTERQTTLI